MLDGKYRVEHLLGEGGMGAVAKATHILRRAPVALKFMSGAVLSLAGAVERFVNEGVAASQIDSDHVVKVFDVGRLPSGAPYLVMEFLEGCDLGQLLEREGPTLPVGRAVHFTLQALRALHTAHAAGIVHRDMKPSNCFIIDKDGEPDFVKLVDFGISKVRAAEDGSSAQLTRTNSALGTPLYMSPEQARSPRDVDHRTDIYSVGAILYEMLAGRTPYTADTGEFTEIL
ncbi:MAG TPA: serine/threonine-protein kinase, partial [Polyangiaceae bacterium]|nr:serine/threonine-protein kinase [Polyangiaceae bacterium]